MTPLHFRSLAREDHGQARNLLTANGVTFDMAFVERILETRTRTEHACRGAFLDNRLVAMYGLYSFPALCLGRRITGLTWCFLVVDSACRGQGLGAAVLEDAAAETSRLSPEFVAGFVDVKLCAGPTGRRTWLSALSQCCEAHGYGDHLRLGTLAPVYRPRGRKAPETERGRHAKLSVRFVDAQAARAARYPAFAEEFSATWPLAELSSERVLRQLAVGDPGSHLAMIEDGSRLVGYVAGYDYIFRGRGTEQRQTHFDSILVAEGERAAALNAVVESLERAPNPPSLYAVNNSSLLTDADLVESSFFRGFSRIEAHAWFQHFPVGSERFEGAAAEVARFSMTVI